MNKKDANRTRRIVEADALRACDASYAQAAPVIDTNFKIVSTYRNALVNWVYDQVDLVGIDIVNRFNKDVFKSLDIAATIRDWQRWAARIMDAIEARDKAVQAIAKYDQSQVYGPSYWLGIEVFSQDRDDAQAIIDQLKGGPEIVGSEGVEFGDPNYLPFSGEALEDEKAA